MSTKINKKQFIEALRKLIRKEIEEASTTVTAGGSQGQGIPYDTPKAFSSGSKAHPKDGEVGGYKKVKEQVNEVMFAVKVDKGDGEVIQTIVNASSKSQAKARIARILKGTVINILIIANISRKIITRKSKGRTLLRKKF